MRYSIQHRKSTKPAKKIWGCHGPVVWHGPVSSSRLPNFAYLVGAAFLLSLLTSCGDVDQVSPHVPSSWPELLSVAQQEADKVKRPAVLSRVTAAPVNLKENSWNYTTGTLKLIFEFVSPPAERITVELEDTAPSTTLIVRQETVPGYEKLLSSSLLESYSSTLRKVKLGPREAGHLTWGDALSHRPAGRATISPIMGFEPALSGGSAEWLIQYVSSDISPLNLGYEMVYTVDAEMGEILERDYNPRPFEISEP